MYAIVAKRRKVVVPSEEFKPMDRTPAERIRESIQSHIPLEQSGVPIFDDLPGSPTKKMDIDPSSVIADNLDRAQRVIDHYGNKVDAIRVSREASSKADQAIGKDSTTQEGE